MAEHEDNGVVFPNMWRNWEQQYPGLSMAAPSFTATELGQTFAKAVLKEAKDQGARDALLIERPDKTFVMAVFEDAALALDMANMGGLPEVGNTIRLYHIPSNTGGYIEPDITAGQSSWSLKGPQ